jgi:hypothetical protein
MKGFNLANYIGQVDGALRCMANPGRTKNNLSVISDAPGISNLGSDCYVSSAYQILVRIPGVYESFAERNEKIEKSVVGKSAEDKREVCARASWMIMSQLLYCKRKPVDAKLAYRMLVDIGYRIVGQDDSIGFLYKVSGSLSSGSERGFVADTTLATRDYETRYEGEENVAGRGRDVGAVGVNVKDENSNGVVRALNGRVVTVESEVAGDFQYDEKVKTEKAANLPRYPEITISQFGERRECIIPDGGWKVPEVIPYGFRRSGGVWAACNKDGEICDENGKVNGEKPDNEQFYLLRMALIHSGKIKRGHYWMVYLAKDHSGGIVVNDGSCSNVDFEKAMGNIMGGKPRKSGISYGACALFYELQDL